MRCDQIKVMACQANCQIALRGVLRQGLQLQREALAQVASTQPGLIEVLQLYQRGFQVIQRDFEFCGQQCRQLFQVLGQITVFIQRIDQQSDHLAIFVIQ